MIDRLLQPVDWWQKTCLAHGVVRGMEYLHSRQPDPVIHGDLKMQNVLVGRHGIPKVFICFVGHTQRKE